MKRALKKYPAVLNQRWKGSGDLIGLKVTLKDTKDNQKEVSL